MRPRRRSVPCARTGYRTLKRLVVAARSVAMSVWLGAGRSPQAMMAGRGLCRATARSLDGLVGRQAEPKATIGGAGARGRRGGFRTGGQAGWGWRTCGGGGWRCAVVAAFLARVRVRGRESARGGVIGGASGSPAGTRSASQSPQGPAPASSPAGAARPRSPRRTASRPEEWVRLPDARGACAGPGRAGAGDSVPERSRPRPTRCRRVDPGRRGAGQSRPRPIRFPRSRPRRCRG